MNLCWLFEQLKKQQKNEKVANKRERKEKKLLANGNKAFADSLIVGYNISIFSECIDGEEDIEKILKDFAAKEKEKTCVAIILIFHSHLIDFRSLSCSSYCNTRSSFCEGQLFIDRPSKWRCNHFRRCSTH